MVIIVFDNFCVRKWNDHHLKVIKISHKYFKERKVQPLSSAIDSDEISVISYVDSDDEQSVPNDDGDACDIDDEIIELGTQCSWNVVDKTTVKF